MGAGIEPTAEELREVRALLLLKQRPELGDRGIRRLVEAWGSGVQALHSLERQGDLLPHASRELPISAWLQEGYRPLPMTSPLYPDSLMDLTDPPAILFLKGRQDLLSWPAVAIVGCRQATEVGRRAAEAMGRVLAAAGIAVVSGMALGIDGAAHRGALEGGGHTVAVLGSGLDIVYPASHRSLYRDIARNGLLVSEFLPGEAVRRHNFPRRNRIIAALARALVVVEAGWKSGALITVEHALDLGRDVLVTPGSVENPRAVGSNALLRDGARLLGDPAAIVEELMQLGFDGPASAEGRLRAEVPVPQDLQPLWAALSSEPKAIDQVASCVGLPTEQVLAGLSTLEMGGWVRRCPGMRFRRG